MTIKRKRRRRRWLKRGNKGAQNKGVIWTERRKGGRKVAEK